MEKAAGIRFYATPGGRCHGMISSRPEDFRVEETVSADGRVPEPVEGYFPLYRVEKRSIDTIHMAKEFSAHLKSRVSYGGLKDARAVAVQYVTPTSSKSARPAEVVHERFKGILVGYLPRPLSRSSVVGNRFEIVVRECCPDVEARTEEAMSLARGKRIPNFFGLQRFGVLGPGTHRVGKAIVKREFKEAVNLLLGGRGSGGKGTGDTPGQTSKEGGELAPELFSRGQDIERMVARELQRRPEDWIRALRAVPLKLRRLYVQAYQSQIFNETLSRAIASREDISTAEEGDNWAKVSADGLVTAPARSAKEKPSSDAVPMVQIVGYAYRDYGSRFDECVEDAMERERIAPSEFFVKEMQEVSAEGGFRRPHLAVNDPRWDIERDTTTLRFTLARGQYATVLIREIIKPEDPAGAGLA